jgi:hypothetical protein
MEGARTSEKVDKSKSESEQQIAFHQKASSPSSSLRDPSIFQSAAGNLAIQRLLGSRSIQAKLTISHPDDPYEQEADRVAEQVMTMPQAEVPPQPT